MNKIDWSKPIEWVFDGESIEKAKFVKNSDTGSFHVETEYGPLYCDEYGTYGANFCGYIRNVQDQSEPEIPQHIYQRVGEVEMFKSGATLRDQFAMAALQGFCVNPDEFEDYETIAIHSYRVADAMMEARKKGN